MEPPSPCFFSYLSFDFQIFLSVFVKLEFLNASDSISDFLTLIFVTVSRLCALSAPSITITIIYQP